MKGLEAGCLLFCHHYIQTCSAEKAARLAGVTLDKALEWLGQPRVVKALQKMRARRAAAMGGETARDRALSLLAIPPADVVKLAFMPPDTPPEALDSLDFSQLAEYRRLSNGTVELKLVDRVKALLAVAEADGGEEGSLASLVQALAPEKTAGWPEGGGEKGEDEKDGGREA